MTQSTTIAPGTILAGKYRVARVLGQGGMGVVVEAQHIQLDDRVALKFLLPEYATHPEASERFLREARAAVKIKSEHVARVSDVGTLETGAPYMVMEYLDGTDLSSMLVKNGPLPLADAVDFVIQACEAINEAHSYGIVHRDIKPANLFVARRQDGSPLVKVLDFGISKTMGAGVDGLTRTTATMGSALYMSPEQMRQSRSVDLRTDIYSMGITLYELLAGKQPFYANTLPELCAEVLTGNPTPLREVRGDLPPQFGTVLERSYARTLDHRYQTISEMVFNLAPFAPARSQETLDRFGRLNNVASPKAGQPNNSDVTAINVNYDAPLPHSQGARAAFASGVGAIPSGTNPGHITNNPTISSTGALSSSSMTSVPKNGSGGVIALLIGAMVLGGVGAGYWFYAKSKATNSTTSASDSGKVPTKSSKPADTTTAPSSDVPPVPPPASASAAPAPASASAEPSAAPSASAQKIADADPPHHVDVPQQPHLIPITPHITTPVTVPTPPQQGNNAGSYR